MLFLFKQKTAYEMRISDWSSDVCSSDLLRAPPLLFRRRPPQSNYPPQRVPLPVSRKQVRHKKQTGWYFTYGSTPAGADASKPPTYATQFISHATLKLQ